MNEHKIKVELGKRIDSELIDELFKEFKELKKAFYKKDKVGVGLYGGRFSEICIASIYNLYFQKKVDINQIHFNYLIDLVLELSKKSPEDDILTLNVPLVLRSIYTLRNKKRIAHIKSFDPNYFDINYIHDACTWVISQIILTLLVIEEKKLYTIVDSIMEKKISIIQEFEDKSRMILKKDIQFKDEILIILYSYSRRLKNEEIKKMLNPRYSSKITTYLKLLNREKLVHINKEGTLLTRLGIKYIEEKFSNLL